MSRELRTAAVTFDKNGVPRATDFDDVYFSADNGLAESRHVFLSGTDIRKHWQNKEDFLVAETGFGTGLNFLATWQAWQEGPNSPGRLLYFSIEHYPLSKADLSCALQPWRALAPLANQLVAAYPLPTPGWHRLEFDGGKVVLVLAFDEVTHALTQAEFRADSWYLDGFAPGKNPAMWSSEVLNHIGELSKPDARVATFTAAGTVRRGLAAAGFSVEKRTGFGQKREMLAGRKLGSAAKRDRAKIWLAPSKTALNTGHAQIVGAGLAGAQMAYALAERGWTVVVSDAASEVATGASGNRWGVLAPKFTAGSSLGERFYLTAWQAQLAQIRTLEQAGHTGLFRQLGVVQLAHNPREAKRAAGFAARLSPEVVTAVTPKDIERLTGITTDYAGYFIPSAGAIAPRALVAALLTHPNIELDLNTAVHLTSADSMKTHCRHNNIDALIIATGAALYDCQDAATTMPIVPARGQSSAASCAPLPRAIIGHEGYLIPENDGVVFGASFVRNDMSTALRDADTEENLARLAAHLPSLRVNNAKNDHAGVRATTPDRWPIAGAQPDWQHYTSAYAGLAQGKTRRLPAAKYLAGIYLLGGLGARGLTTSAYCASVLADEITGTPCLVERSIRESMHPARFLTRAYARTQAS